MDLQALANIAQILSAAAVIAAIVFGLIQIRQFRLQRRDAAAAELVRSFHDPLFAQSLRLIAALPNDAKAERLRAGGVGMEDAALYIGVRFETIGLLVFRGVMPLSLVDHLVGPRAVSLWSRLRDWSRLVREEEGREHFLEWFQWLAEQLDKIGRHGHAPAFVKISRLVTAARMSNQAFTEFEHRGWQRVADKYDSTWASSTRQFIAPLLDMAEVGDKMSILDLGCGPGYVSAAATERGATAIGLDFSSAMIAIARKKLPRLNFREGDAQNLPFDNEMFDRVVANFALLHLAAPKRAFAEAFRVLKHGGKFGFTTWARKEENAFLRLVDDAIQACANFNVDLPPGPPYYLFETPEEFCSALSRAGFDGASMKFKLHTIQWRVPSANFVFEAERNAGVRTAGLLARQTPERLDAIKARIENAVRSYARGNGFAIPKSAYIVAVTKS